MSLRKGKRGKRHKKRILSILRKRKWGKRVRFWAKSIGNRRVGYGRRKEL